MTTRKGLLLLIAFALLVLVIWQQFAGQAKPKETAWVVVAKGDIPPYTILSTSDVITAELSLADAVDCFPADDMYAPVGMMTTTEMRQGNKISKANVLEVEGNWPSDSTDDMLIGSFRVDTAHIVGGQLRPGHHIDLLATRPETNVKEAESMWLAQDIWVVGVYQSGGDDVLRPTIVLRPTRDPDARETPIPTEVASGGGLGIGGFSSTSVTGSRGGPANLVVVAVPRDTARMISDYFGARLYDAWVYVRPGDQRASKGRIDGLVFHDVEPDLIQQRGEAGLDDVKIVIKTSKGVELSSARTASGGKFTFDNLSTGVYFVEETDPAGFGSLSANRLRVEISPGQNLHVQFSDVALPTPEPVVEEKVVVATPVPTKEPTAEPAKTAEAESAASCNVSAYITDRDGGGPSSGSFPESTEVVWVAVDHRDCPQGTPYRVEAYMLSEPERVELVKTGTWSLSSKVEWWEIKSWHGGAFTPGGYIVQVHAGADSELMANATFHVEPPGEPPVGGDTGTQDHAIKPESPEAVTDFGFGHGR